MASTLAPAVAVARFGGPVKRLEDALEIPVRNAGAAIPNQNRQAARRVHHRDLDGCVRRAVANDASVPCSRASFKTWLISESRRSISRSIRSS